MRFAFTLATCLLSSLAPAEAQQRQSIVGTWSTAAGRCVKPLSMIVIGPKSLASDDFSCEFETVSRVGDVVTWRGSCAYGGDKPANETVTARLAGNRLYYSIRSVGGENGPFMRCP